MDMWKYWNNCEKRYEGCTQPRGAEISTPESMNKAAGILADRGESLEIILHAVMWRTSGWMGLGDWKAWLNQIEARPWWPKLKRRLILKDL